MVPELISGVLSTLDPDYKWMRRRNTHHMYGDTPLDQSLDNKSQTEAIFCDLPPSKLQVPVDFHGWLHEVSIMPPTPPTEVMNYRIEAWRVALDLFVKARDLTITDKRARRRRQHMAKNRKLTLKHQKTDEDLLGEAYLNSQYERNFKGFLMHLDLYRSVPVEFMVAPLPEDDSPFVIASILGKFVTKGAIALPQRAFELAA